MLAWWSIQSPRRLAFTGSLGGGRALFDLAAARPEPIPVYAEMGSTNPIFPVARCDCRRWRRTMATALSQSVMLGVGQFCTSPGIIVTGNDQQAATLIAAMREQLPAAAPGTMLHAGIRRNFDQGTGPPSRSAGSGNASISGCAFYRVRLPGALSPFLHRCCHLPANPVMAEEVFGPATIVVQCNDASEMLQVAEMLAANLPRRCTARMMTSKSMVRWWQPSQT